MTERFLTAREIAERLDVSPETVLRYTRLGYLRGIRLPGTVRGRLRYREEDFEAFLQAGDTAGDGNREVSPTRAAAHRPGVSSDLSPTPLGTRRARTEED